MDKEKHADAKYCSTLAQAQLKYNDPRFKNATEIRHDLVEIEMCKSTITFDLPIQLGFHILQMAKLRMLEFKYGFMNEFYDDKDFEYLEMDTDSAYLALSGENLESIVKPKMQKQFVKAIRGRCDGEAYDATDYFLPRVCCDEHKAFDSRTPGLFKVEAEGVAMISLCSKTYVLKQSDGKCKLSSKGINKEAITEPYNKYSDVLTTGEPVVSTNRGFRKHDNTIFTYAQQKRGLNYFYIKRVVLPDGVNTKPLDITLCPWGIRKPYDVVDSTHRLSLTRTRKFKIGDKIFNNLRLVCEAAMFEKDPIDFVRLAVQQLPPYNVTCDILVAVTKSLKDANYKFWNKDTFWTTGLSERSSILRRKPPGQNQLGLLLMELKDRQ